MHFINYFLSIHGIILSFPFCVSPLQLPCRAASIFFSTREGAANALQMGYVWIGENVSCVDDLPTKAVQPDGLDGDFMDNDHFMDDDYFLANISDGDDDDNDNEDEDDGEIFIRYDVEDLRNDEESNSDEEDFGDGEFDVFTDDEE